LLLEKINIKQNIKNLIISEPILVFSDLNLNDFIRFLRNANQYKKLQYFLSTLKVIYLTRFYQNPYILATHLRFLILLERKHKQILYNISNLLNFHNMFNKHLTGITIKVIGRINRATRAKKFTLTIGDALDLYTFKSLINYAYVETFAKIGNFGIHV
jgi:ribosomal protein S3